MVDWVDGSTNSKINLPKDTLDECPYNSDKYKMHEYEQDNDPCIVIRTSPAVIVDDSRPASLGEHLHQQILWIYECFEVRELDVLIIIWVIWHKLWVVKDLHPENAQNVV